MKKSCVLMCTVAVVAMFFTSCDPALDYPTETKFKVTFDSRGGTAVAEQSIEKSAKVTKPENPSRKGYNFLDWFRDEALTTVWNFDTDKVEANITLYAGWEAQKATVDKSALESRIASAEKLTQATFTPDSWTTMQKTLTAAKALVANPDATAEQIAEAIRALDAAVAALVASPAEGRAPARIFILDHIVSVPDGTIYITPGQHVSFGVAVVDKYGYTADNNQVEFVLPENLPSWLIPTEHGNGKSSFTRQIGDEARAGEQVPIRIVSKAKPDVVVTVMLKVPQAGEVVSVIRRILDNQLPAVDKISFEHTERIYFLQHLYSMLSEEEKNTNEMHDAGEKIELYVGAARNLPERFRFSVAGNTVTHDGLRDNGTIDYSTLYIFEPSGDFPCGTYTTPWLDSEDGTNEFWQVKMVLNSDKTLSLFARKADDAIGTGATPKELEATATWRIEGNKERGGVLYLTYE